MKTVANRMIVFAASALALGTMAFAQTPMTAHVPFAFRTVTGTLPAGTYEFREERLNGLQHMIYVRNTASNQGNTAGVPIFDGWNRSEHGAETVVFVCARGACSLKAIKTNAGTLEYQTPRLRKADKATVSEVSVPLKTANAE